MMTSIEIMKKIHSKGNVWKYAADTGAWFFVTLDPAAREAFDCRKGKRCGWGQVAVRVTLGNTVWKTSVFPDKRHGYVLPLKAQIRKKEGIKKDDMIEVILEMI